MINIYFLGDSFEEIFNDIRQDMMLADEVKARGMLTKELLNVTICLKNPRARLIFSESRKFNYAFSVAEMFSHMAGINSVKYMSFWNSNYAQFSDNGINFYGNYGERLRNFIPEIIKKLKSDKNTRQATLTIYNSNDLIKKSLDIPCTIVLDFKLRKDKLHMHVFMRSNDLIWGLMYDLAVFTMMQEIIANSLNVGLGFYNHTACSLHVYEKHWLLLDKMYDAINVPMLDIKENYEQILYGARIAQEIIEYPSDNIYVSHLLQALALYGIKKNKQVNYKNELKRHLMEAPEFLIKMMRLENYMGGNNGK